MVKAVPS